MEDIHVLVQDLSTADFRNVYPRQSRTFRDQPLNKIPNVLIIVGGTRETIHQGDRQKLAPDFLASPLVNVASVVFAEEQRPLSIAAAD